MVWEKRRKKNNFGHGGQVDIVVRRGMQAKRSCFPPHRCNRHRREGCSPLYPRNETSHLAAPPVSISTRPLSPVSPMFHRPFFQAVHQDVPLLWNWNPDHRTHRVHVSSPVPFGRQPVGRPTCDLVVNSRQQAAGRTWQQTGTGLEPEP